MANIYRIPLYLVVVCFVLSLVTPEVLSVVVFSPELMWVEPWRFVTGAFFHVDAMHLVLNMVGLWFLGVGLERMMGSTWFSVVLLVGLFAGQLGILLWGEQDTLTLGASGVVFGFFAAYVLVCVFLRAWRQLAWLFPVFLVNVVASFSPGVSWQAHMGGMVGGGLVALVWGVLFVWVSRSRLKQQRVEVLGSGGVRDGGWYYKP